MRTLFLALTIAASLVSPSAKSQRRQMHANVPQVHASQVVSPTSLATWVMKPLDDRAVDLLVIWRGAPGWFVGKQGQRTSGGGSGDYLRTEIEYAGISLTLEFWRDRRRVTVQGKEVPLGSANVVLVDSVDGSEGPRVVRILTLNPNLFEPRRVGPMLQRSRDVMDFLRCDAAVEDEKLRSKLQGVCAG